MKKNLKRFISIFIDVILIAFIVVLLLLQFNKVSVPVHLFNVQSGSMTPLIPIGSLIVTKEIAPQELSTGDIITFKTRDDIVVSHRIVAIHKNKDVLTFETKGDANNAVDYELVNTPNIQGKMIFHVPHIGVFGAMIQTPWGKIAFGSTLIQLWCAVHIVSLLRQSTPIENEQITVKNKDMKK